MTDDILFNTIHGKGGSIGQIILNRGKALNALNANMLDGIAKHITEWEQQADIKAIVIKSSSDKAFCAGGDIKMIYQHKATLQHSGTDFFKHEYACNANIFHCKKPYIALLNGICMGGGVGISLPGMFRVATENLVWAMPESMIGFFPDVGAAYYLSRLPKHIGFYLGLSGNRINACDAHQLGLATHTTSAHQIEHLEKKLIDTDFAADQREKINAILLEFHEPMQHSELDNIQETLHRCFAKPNVEDIISALEAEDDACQRIAKDLLSRSPSSLKVTLKHLQQAKHQTFDESIAVDLTLATHFLKHNDFYEGIRAMVIDKDRTPQWQPKSLTAVNMQLVDSYFSS